MWIYTDDLRLEFSSLCTRGIQITDRRLTENAVFVSTNVHIETGLRGHVIHALQKPPRPRGSARCLEMVYRTTGRLYSIISMMSCRN